MTAMLKAEGLQVDRKRVQRLMRKMAIAAPGPKPNTTKPAPGHKIYPYLLQDDDRPAAADITYRPIGRGFFYFVAIIDWASRTVLAWRLSNTMDASFCVAALEALATYGTPEIYAMRRHRRDNSDQGSQSPVRPSAARWRPQGIKIPMDGRGPVEQSQPHDGSGISSMHSGHVAKLAKNR